MTGPWWTARGWLALCAAALVSAWSQLAAAPLPVEGEVVDANEPIVYRLPLVSRADSRAPRLAQRTNVAFTPASSPADERRTWEPVGPLAADMAPYVPTIAGLTSQLLPAVQRGYTLAQRGALYAARTEFVQVLRRIAQAQDAAANTDRHSRSLAAGLRALDEADDFVPEGIQLEAELDVAVVASSHRTPVLRGQWGNVLPHEAVALYHSFAQQQLAEAAAGDQAGSMALYGLGKIAAQLAERRDDDLRYVRTAMTMYSAALAARPDNHMATNELGVLLCRTGRPAEGARLFERTIDFAPSATTYHNLAVAQQMLGMHGPAEANEQESQRLAAWERATGAVSRRAGIQWVSPDAMASATQTVPLAPAAYDRDDPARHANAATTQEPAKSVWQRTLAVTRSLPRPGSGSASDEPGLRPAARPNASPGSAQWR